MIPLRDNIPSRTTPVVNYTMIGLCALAFVGQLLEQSAPQPSLVERFGMIPARVFHPERPVEIEEVVQEGQYLVQRTRTAAEPPFSPWLTLLTCIFLHGGWLHFLGNMWFLYIFGDNVEDRMGHVGYLLFYVGCGVTASFAHLFTNAASTIPTIGASGAIAGVMGAYLLLYPRAMVVTLVPIIYFLQILVIPAPVFLVIWFLLQFFQGVMTITSTEAGGVAWWAHIGGFAVGFLVAGVLVAVGETRPPVQQRRPNTEHMSAYRYPHRRW